jgi:ribosomal protein S17E
MGRIKSLAIKKTAKKLAGNVDNFTKEFDHNKNILKDYSLPDKSTRNKIAGHITRLKKTESINK